MKLPDVLDARLRQEAARRHLTISDLTREAIEAHLGGPSGPRRRIAGGHVWRSGESDVSSRIEEILATELSV